VSIDETPAERAYARQERTPDLSAPLHALAAWAANLGKTGRRQATSVAVDRLRQWCAHNHDDRPSRGELRAWVTLVLDKLEALSEEVRGLRREVEALTAQRDGALEDLVAERRAHDADVAGLAAQRDDALAEERVAREASTMYAEEAERLRSDLDRMRALVSLADEDRTRRTRERDQAQATVVEQVKCYEDLRAAYFAAEGRGNQLAREVRELRAERKGRGVGRASCSHPAQGGGE
jgi:hypothetical protein